MPYNLDIAGFYYQRTDIDAPPNSTIKAIMEAASAADIVDRAAGSKRPLLQFMVDPMRPEFINTISVSHIDRAVSRQRPNLSPPRSYDPGEYVFTDEPVKQVMNSARDVYFVATDQNGNEIEKDSVRTWQYYIYDAAGVDQSRKPGAQPRTVVPFASQPVADGSLIVWRVVSIFLGPTWQGGTKSSFKTYAA